MRSDTSRGLRYYCQGSILAMAALLAMAVPLVILARIAQDDHLSHTIGSEFLPLVMLLGLALLMLAGSILSLVGMLTLRSSHPAYLRALIALAVGYVCNLLGMFLPGWLGRAGQAAGLVASVVNSYYLVQATAALLEAQRDAMELPDSAAAFFNRLIRRGWLSWKLELAVGVAQSVNTLLPVSNSLLMIGFLVVLLVIALVAFGLSMSFFLPASRLL